MLENVFQLIKNVPPQVQFWSLGGKVELRLSGRWLCGSVWPFG